MTCKILLWQTNPSLKAHQRTAKKERKITKIHPPLYFNFLIWASLVQQTEVLFKFLANTRANDQNQPIKCQAIKIKRYSL